MRSITLCLPIFLSGMLSGLAAQNSICDEPFGTIDCNKYSFQNCVWNPVGNWTQCVQTFCDTANSWSVEWTFESATWVQSYPNARVTEAENPGLPWQVSSNRPTFATWVIDTIGGNSIGYHAYTAAFDIWTTKSPWFAGSSPKMELMIWLYRSGAVGSAGTIRDTIPLEGYTWIVYAGTMSTWKYIAFLPTKQLKRVDALNISTFVNYAQNAGLAIATDYVTCVAAGHELGGGTGYAKTSNFKVWWGTSASTMKPAGKRSSLYSSSQVYLQTGSRGFLNQAGEDGGRLNMIRYNIDGSLLKANQCGHASGVYAIKKRLP